MTDAPKKGWFQRLSAGLARSSQQMTETVVSAFVKEPLSEEALDRLEEHLLESDLGPAATDRIVERFRQLRFGKVSDEREVKEALAEAVAAELLPRQAGFDPLGPDGVGGGIKPFVVLFVGVNGSGKTTTLGKIAADLTRRGARVMIVAGDTFRAAAREQLKVWEAAGYGHLPVCMAKTQYSFTTDPNMRGAPTGFTIPVREVRLSAGAGFIVAICGEIMTMPGLPRVPSAEVIRLNAAGQIEGLF